MAFVPEQHREWTNAGFVRPRMLARVASINSRSSLENLTLHIYYLMTLEIPSRRFILVLL